MQVFESTIGLADNKRHNIPAMQIKAMLDRVGIDKNRAFVVMVNSRPVLRANFNQQLNDSDFVAIVYLLQGGGEGKNPLNTVAQIALMGLSFYMPVLMGVTNKVFASFLTAGTLVGGNLILNKLLPFPEVPTGQNDANKAPSPTYNIAAKNNLARLGESIPCVYGRHQLYPDLAAQPFTEFENNEQYLYMLLCLGHGHVEVEDIRLEDTPISNFEDISYEVYPPGEPVTQFADIVVTSPEVTGQELMSEWLGPFIVSDAGQNAEYLSIDLTLPLGYYQIYHLEGSQYSFENQITVKVEAQIQPIDNDGAPLTSEWYDFGYFIFRGIKKSQELKTFKRKVPSGRYQLRIRKNETDILDKQYVQTDYLADKVLFTSLKAVLPEVKYYDGLTLISMRAKATETLNSSNFNKISVIAKRKLFLYDDGWTGTPIFTNDIAPIVLDLLKNNVYGAGLRDDDIDLDEIARLNALWQARGDTFNAVFDQKLTLWEALATILRVGRTIPYAIFEKIYFIRDEPQEMIKGMYTPLNIVKDSFSIQYTFPGPDTSDCLDVEIINDQYWKTDTVRCDLNSGSGVKPAKVKFFGCTNKNQAYREGMYLLACQRYQQKEVKFKTELDAFNNMVGDRIAISHDLVNTDILSSKNAYIVSFDADKNEFILSEHIGESINILIRDRKGVVHGPYWVLGNKCAYSFMNTQEAYEVGGYIQNGGEPAYVMWDMSVYDDFMITSIRPEKNLIEIIAINYADNVYLAEEIPQPTDDIENNIPTLPKVSLQLNKKQNIRYDDGVPVEEWFTPLLYWDPMQYNYKIVGKLSGSYDITTYYNPQEDNTFEINDYYEYIAVAVIDNNNIGPWSYMFNLTPDRFA